MTSGRGMTWGWPLPLVLLLAAAGCGWPSTSAPNCARGAEAGPGEPLRVLFIGNSLTYTNALPSMLRSLADSAGELPPEVSDVTAPDYSLEDHWNDGNALRAIRRGCFDVVALQQGPSALPESRVLLLEYTRRFGREIRGRDAEPALYSVWPSSSRSGDFAAAIESYRLAAAEVDGVLLPAAAAWRAALERDAAVPLYRADGLHPTVEGTYLAALVVFARLYGREPVGLPARLAYRDPAWRQQLTLDIPPALAAILQAAAAEALAAGSP